MVRVFMHWLAVAIVNALGRLFLDPTCRAPLSSVFSRQNLNYQAEIPMDLYTEQSITAVITLAHRCKV